MRRKGRGAKGRISTSKTNSFSWGLKADVVILPLFLGYRKYGKIKEEGKQGGAYWSIVHSTKINLYGGIGDDVLFERLTIIEAVETRIDVTLECQHHFSVIEVILLHCDKCKNEGASQGKRKG